MDDDLIGYLVGALDAEDHSRVEARMRERPESSAPLDVLRRALVPLASDKDEIEPDPGLIYRTLARVAEYRCRPLPPAPVPAPVLRSPPPSAWMRRDVVVAASVLLLLGGFGLVGLFQARQSHQQLLCQNTLHDYHQALTVYSDGNGGAFPMIDRSPPTHLAGSVVPMLVSAGAMRPDLALRCPDHPQPRTDLPSLEQLAQMSPEQIEQLAPQLSGCYAYTLGYLGPDDKLCGLCRHSDEAELNNDLLPIMADRPQVLAGGDRCNSPNHLGQNVLTVGGTVGFWRTERAGLQGDHIYRNRDGKVAAGLDWSDTVLGFGKDKP